MSLTDPISNLLTSIRNALHAHKETVDIPAFRLGQKVLEIFKADGYIEDFRLLKDNKQGMFKIYLKYGQDKQPVILGLRRISKPGLRIYANRYRVPRVINGLGTAVLTTSRGVMTDRDARKSKIGGEVLCYVW